MSMRLDSLNDSERAPRRKLAAPHLENPEPRARTNAATPSCLWLMTMPTSPPARSALLRL